MDIDILEIDRKIRKNFEERNKKLEEHNRHLEELNKTYNSPQLSNKYFSDISKAISENKDAIKSIEENRDYSFYISDTLGIIQEYEELLKKPIKVSFMKKTRGDDEISIKKKKLVQEYMTIASKYYQIQPQKISPKKINIINKCNNCLNNKDFYYEDNTYICSLCSSQQDCLYNNILSYKDSDRINITTKYTYDRKSHFRDCINQYQGKQNCRIEQKVYDDLESCFEKHHLLIGDKNTPKNERFSKITKNHINIFLKDLGYSKHYENVILIYHNITGVKPDDISHLEDKLLADFDALVETYDKLFKNKIERINFISTQYVLYQLLLKHKHPCKKEDFAILKTMDRKAFHDDICRELFEHLGWTFTN